MKALAARLFRSWLDVFNSQIDRTQKVYRAISVALKAVNIDSEVAVGPAKVATAIDQRAILESAAQKILVVHRYGGVLERLVFDVGHDASWAVKCGQHSTPCCIQEATHAKHRGR